MKSKTRSVRLRGRKYVYVGGSLLPRMISISLDATAPSRWLRVGLIPGLGQLPNTGRFFSLMTWLWVKAPESRTASVEIRPASHDESVDRSLYGTQRRDRSKLVRWGLLGTAHINKAIIPPMRRSRTCELVAVASRDRERGQQYAKAWQIPKAFSDYDELLASDLVDAVYIPLPNHLHAEYTIRALRAGKHVLCEKPIALTVEDVDAIARAAEESGCVVAEAFMYRHHRRTKRVKELLDTGAIGKLRSIQGAFTFQLQSPENIRLDQETGGGSLWDVGCYPVSFARYLVGSEPEQVFGYQRLGSSGIDLHFSGLMRFPRGITAQFVSGFDAPQRMDLVLTGSEGIIELPAAYKPARTSTIILKREDGSEERIAVETGGLYRGELEDMAAAILDDKPPLIPLSDSRANVRVIQALYESARSGRPVDLA